MLFEKSLLGERSEQGLSIHYYIIHKEAYFGVAIEEHQANRIQCHHEYFTENQQEAYNVALQMQEGFVTGITMPYILDDKMN